ncbi:MAG: PepSY-associated TM helix domain-containing protein [Pedobacter sp.]|uniref:PepSY-associated TM helix domain-containing protein n=1 Tax=Pedobacter sp. TaxID=1411316 RepID=UPI0033916455
MSVRKINKWSFGKINAWFHLWLGIASGIVVLILGITGCILVFEQEIKQLSRPWFRAEKPAGGGMVAPSVIYRAVGRAIPEKKVSSVWYHGEGYSAHVSLDASDSVVYVNPYTAGILAVALREDFFDFIDDGHLYLWLPDKIGHQVVGWSTLVFFLLSISGLILWWPGKWNKKAQQQSFKIKWKAKFKRLNYDLHNVLGFYMLLLALLFALTGLIMSFSWINNSVFWLAGGESQPRVKSVSDTSANPQSDVMLQVDKAWRKGFQQISEHNQKNIIIKFPEKASDPIYLCTDMYRGTWRDVYLDQYTLKELPGSAQKLKDLEFSNWIRRSNYGLHVGEIGGLPTKILYFFGSLVCASLPVTGFYIWWGRKKHRRNNKFLSS